MSSKWIFEHILQKVLEKMFSPHFFGVCFVICWFLLWDPALEVFQLLHQGRRNLPVHLGEMEAKDDRKGARRKLPHVVEKWEPPKPP